jgi:hypothetical protein
LTRAARDPRRRHAPARTQPHNAFMLGFMTPFGLKMLRKHGHQKAVLVDGTKCARPCRRARVLPV